MKQFVADGNNKNHQLASKIISRLRELNFESFQKESLNDISNDVFKVVVEVLEKEKSEQA